MSAESTPVTQGKKRELTSPEFDIDSKKNKCVPVSPISELGLKTDSDLDMSDDNLNSTETMATSESTESHILIPPSEMAKLSEMLKSTFRQEIVGLVNEVVEGVLSGLRNQISSLETSNRELKEENTVLRTRVETLEQKVDKAEQYSRRNCLRISGLDETALENTDDIVLKIAGDIGSGIQLADIDRSHRVGNPTRRTKPRDIIVKFATYRSRQDFYKKRTLLKDHGYLGVFANEDLTKFRSGMLYEARKLAKKELIKGAWSADGNILVRDKFDIVHRINVMGDLHQFGLLVVGPSEQPRYRRQPAGQRSAVVTAGRSLAVAARDPSPDDRDMQ